MFLLNKVNPTHFSCQFVCCITYKLYICTVFFMVLDLRLTMRLAVREDGLSFYRLIPFWEIETCLIFYAKLVKYLANLFVCNDAGRYQGKT